MKKKILIFSIFILLLIPFNTKAYTYSGSSIKIDTLKKNGWINIWPSNSQAANIYVSSEASIQNSDYFFYHSANNNSNSYIGLSANIGKTASDTATSNYDMDLVETFNTLEDNISDDKKELIEDLLTNGYHFDTTNTQPVNNILSKKESTLSMMAMQILLWEVMEGARTNFDTYAPNVYNGSNNFYNLVVYPNGGSGRTSGTLFYYYTKIIDDVFQATNPESASAFNTELYVLSWDGTNKKYNATVSGIGKYTTCTSNNEKVNVNVSGKNVTISSNSNVSIATITCSYRVGSGTNDNFYYFKFKKQNACSVDGNCSKIVYGSGKKTYTRSFDVSTESTNIGIKKISTDKKELDGSKFSLTHRSTTNYSLSIKGNDKESTAINKSGEYIVSETVVPSGYEKVSDFNIKIDVKSGRILDCTNKGQDTNGNLTCMNGQVGVTYSGKNILLTIVDPAKNFKIQKIDENNRGLNGTTFQIKNSKNELMKFNYDGNMFVYNPNGLVTDLNISNNSSYPIALLPKGDYTIVETVPPTPYRLSSKESERITKIQVNASGEMFVYDNGQKNYISSINSTVYIKNYRTLFRISSSSKGTSLGNVKYYLYKEDKTTQINSVNNFPGVYSYSENQELGSNEYVSNSDGLITVYDLPVGTYYLKQDDPNSSYIKIVIDVTKDGATVNGSKVVNTMNISAVKNSFSFYKTDEEGNYLTSGRFKLQKYDETKKRYVDLRLEKVENDGTYNEKSNIFRENKDGKIQFTLTNGIGTFIDMSSSARYRVVETDAPAGYIMGSTSDTANVTLDENGNAYGLLVLTNKKILSEEGAAEAELIINIQTGQNRIKYAVIISSIIVFIIALLIIQRRKK